MESSPGGCEGMKDRKCDRGWGEKGAAYLLYLTDSCVYDPPNTLIKQFFDEHPQMLHVELKLKLILQKESI